jgi:hypothetical protein
VDPEGDTGEDSPFGDADLFRISGSGFFSESLLDSEEEAEDVVLLLVPVPEAENYTILICMTRLVTIASVYIHQIPMV